jgi:steroid delta-isomerase-like uncharacterized protein
MSEQNKTVVRRIVDEHWNKRNAAVAAELFADNCSLQTPDGPLNGHEGARKLLSAFETGFPDFHLTIDELIAEGDKVAFRYTFTGTHKGKFGETAASGARVTATGMGMYRIVAGKVAEGRLEWDRARLQEQIGAAKSAAKPVLQPA